MRDTVKAWIEERRAIQNSGVPFPARDSRANFPRSLDALNAVLELHKPMSVVTSFVPVCTECEEIGGGDVAWPCATVQAIEGAINE